MIFYTGCYTVMDGSPAPNPIGKGIGRFEFEPDTGKFKQLDYTLQRSPSYPYISKDKKTLYAAEECKQSLSPKLFAYKIREQGTLSLLNSQDINGAYACHLCEVNKQVIVANYMTGNAVVYPIQEDGSLAFANQTIQHTGCGIHPERQTGPHVHMVCQIDGKRYFLVDLGLDKALSYTENESGAWIPDSGSDIQAHLGAGARHMVLSDNNRFAYILGELSGKIEVFKKCENGFISVQNISFVTEKVKGDISGAAIKLHPTGEFLYASERESGTIAVFKVNPVTGELSFMNSVDAKGKTPRDFSIDPTGEWLFVANQDSNLVVAFTIKQNGTLQYVSEQHVGTPVCIAFL